MNRLFSKSVKYKHAKNNSDELHYVDIKCHKCGEVLPYTYAQLLCLDYIQCPFCDADIKIDREALFSNLYENI